jgi:hypothetical protein
MPKQESSVTFSLHCQMTTVGHGNSRQKIANQVGKKIQVPTDKKLESAVRKTYIHLCTCSMALVVKSNAHDKPPHPSIQLTVLCLWASSRTQITYTQLLPHMQITPRGTKTLEPTKNLLTEFNHLREGVTSKV